MLKIIKLLLMAICSFTAIFSEGAQGAKEANKRFYTCTTSGKYSNQKEWKESWRWGGYLNITEEGGSATRKLIKVSGHLTIKYYFPSNEGYNRELVIYGGTFDGVSVHADKKGAPTSILGTLFPHLNDRAQNLRGDLELGKARQLKDGRETSFQSIYTFKHGPYNLKTNLSLTCFERNLKKEQYYNCTSKNKMSYDLSHRNHFHIIETKTPQGLRSITTFGHVRGEVFVSVEGEENPHYRPRKYKGYSQFKDIDSTLQSEGMWGNLIIPKDTDRASFEAHYIHQQGDHYGGTLHMTCSSNFGFHLKAL